MPKPEVGTPKWIANQMKSKGLMKLRWFFYAGCKLLLRLGNICIFGTQYVVFRDCTYVMLQYTVLFEAHFLTYSAAQMAALELAASCT